MPLSFYSKIKRLHPVLLGTTLALATIGVIAIYSATYMRTGPWEHLTQLWRKQMIWVAFGLVVHFVASFVDYRKWVCEYHGAWILYIVGLVLLIITRFFGEERSGAQSWLSFGPIDLQTSQVAMIGGILALAVFLAHPEAIHDTLEAPALQILIAGALVGAPFLLILEQPDLGSALVWLPVFFACLVVAGIPKRYLITLVLLVVGIAVPLAVAFVLRDYQLVRLLVFLDPENPNWRQDEAYGIWNSLLAIGSSGMTGKGFLAQNSQNSLGFLPIATAPTDYIFAVLAEEHGFCGGAIIIGLFTALLLSILWIALNAADNPGSLIATGIAALFFTHIFLNVGMVVSLVPITGLPLPLISYGGSFALLTLFSLGILQSIWIHRDTTS